MPQQAQNLVLEADECLTLTPDSPRFKDAVERVRPQTIAEVRRILGPSVDAGPNTPHPACCLAPELSGGFPDPDALTSADPQVRYRARQLAQAAASAYVRAADVSQLRLWEPLLDRFIQLNKASLAIFRFADIDIANGATLTLGVTTHALYAGNIRMYGTGRIVAKGPKTIRSASLSGPTRPHIVGTINAADTAALQSAMRNA
jgi:hypothetical protein